jgi:hypothetical protein
MDMGRTCCAKVGRFLKATVNLLDLILVLCTHFVGDSGLQESRDISTICCSHTPYIVANNVRLIDTSAQRDKLINRFGHRAAETRLGGCHCLLFSWLREVSGGVLHFDFLRSYRRRGRLEGYKRTTQNC